MKKGIRIRNIVVGAVFAIILAAVLLIIFSFGKKPEEEIKKIGFITTGDFSGTGWSVINYQGVKAACEELDAELLTLADIPEDGGMCSSAVDKLIMEGAGMIILNSSVYSDEMRPLLESYPEIVFYGANASFSAPNLTPYSARLYQVRYLSGIVAGAYTKVNKIGFVAAEKEDLVNRGINAFALGVRRVNPDAEVVVAWTDSWDDEAEETEMARALIEKEGVDVITYMQHRPYVINVAEQYGVASIGYYEPVRNASELYLTCAMCDWTPVYESLIKEYLRGEGNSVEGDWIGLESGALSLTGYSPLVSDKAVEEVQLAREEILSGKDVFTGEIYDNNGVKRCSEGEALSDETLLNRMDWLAEGVRVYDN